MVYKTSPRLSFKGYNLGTAMSRNKDSIKAIVAVLGGINFALGLNWKMVGLTVVGAICTLIVKLLADAVDYYFTEVEIIE